MAGVRPLYPRATTFTCHATGRQRATPTLVPHAQTCRGSAAVTATHSALTLEIRVEFPVRTQMCLSRSTRKRGNRCYEIWYGPMSRMRYQTPRSMFAFPAAKTGHTVIAVWTVTGSKSPYSGSNNHSGVHHLGHYIGCGSARLLTTCRQLLSSAQETFDASVSLSIPLTRGCHF